TSDKSENYPTDNAIHDDSFEARYLAMCKERSLLQTVQTVLTEITIVKALNHCGRTCHTSMDVLFSRAVSLGMGFSTFWPPCQTVTTALVRWHLIPHRIRFRLSFV